MPGANLGAQINAFLTLAGGAGVLMYAAFWVFMPQREDVASGQGVLGSQAAAGVAGGNIGVSRGTTWTSNDLTSNVGLSVRF